MRMSAQKSEKLQAINLFYCKKRDAFETAGICPYGYLPERWGAELLPNLIKLIEKKVDDFFNNGGIA